MFFVCNQIRKGTTLVVRCKLVPVTDREGPGVCDTSRLPHFLDNRLTDGGEVVSLTRRLPFTPQGIFLVLISVRGWVDPRAILRLEGLGPLKKLNDIIGNQICDLLACSIVPQPTKLPRTSWRRMGSGCIDPHFLDLSTSWRAVVSFMPRSLYPLGKSLVYP
jgi:hypothetical protein